MTADDPWDTNNREKSRRKTDLMMKGCLCAPAPSRLKIKDAEAGPCCMCARGRPQRQMASKLMCWGLAKVYKASPPFKKVIVSHTRASLQRGDEKKTKVNLKWRCPCLKCLRDSSSSLYNESIWNTAYFTLRYAEADQGRCIHFSIHLYWIFFFILSRLQGHSSEKKKLFQPTSNCSELLKWGNCTGENKNQYLRGVDYSHLQEHWQPSLFGMEQY